MVADPLTPPKADLSPKPQVDNSGLPNSASTSQPASILEPLTEVRKQEKRKREIGSVHVNEPMQLGEVPESEDRPKKKKPKKLKTPDSENPKVANETVHVDPAEKKHTEPSNEPKPLKREKGATGISVASSDFKSKVKQKQQPKSEEQPGGKIKKTHKQKDIESLNAQNADKSIESEENSMKKKKKKSKKSLPNGHLTH